MDHDENLEEVQRILNYRFRNITLLSHALTAAGADLDNYEGNRRLAPIGVDVIGLCLDYDAHQKKGKPSETAVLKQQLCCYKHLALVAQRTSIDKCIKYNPRSGKGSPTVVGKSLAAIIAAAYLDSGNHSDTWGVMHYIGFFIQNQDGINPAMLESTADCQTHLPIISPLVPQCNISSNDIEAGSDFMAVPRRRAAEGAPCEIQANKAKVSRSQRSLNDRLEPFLARESERCRALGIAVPEESYYKPEIQMEVAKLVKDTPTELPKKLLLGVATSQSVVILKKAIVGWRTQTGIVSWQLSKSASKAEAFQIIESMSQDMMCLALLRRYYILRLFEDCRGCDTPSFTGFVSVSGSGVLSRKRGNPLNNAENDLTTAMMKEIFPALQPGTQEYDVKRGAVNLYRKLGRKFHMLASTFGKGILALMPYYDLPGEPEMSISDNQLHSLRESTFGQIISILERSQGEVICQFSAAAERIVDALMELPVECCPVFAFEEIAESRILECPKNSSGLLSLLGLRFQAQIVTDPYPRADEST
ncbi:uncharacterized protein BP01DRAFT_403803 [Aspergillus saccharolyticus JOP 1030-1]|uniref:RNase III domain-containing protein n=1 Tax=Aspergillus saccharolyticus JOP 1030-1 TaxID=1450539 RepID=A0A318Z6M0_9EURO|nr:hypothetical protein BP01DRAFT_403803 [Aspergillus saccharolyticus JOP 1030-1]PYH42935.1 hypothetical protein BP01DRAFT_403803 [Aspergillus saccharolyticus JOP 1030-1]